MEQIRYSEKFENRHIGPQKNEIEAMLGALGESDLNSFIDKVVPENIRLKDALDIEDELDEREMLEEIEQIAAKNKVCKSYIGLGYHPVFTPSVIRRNIFENPGWYTQYTPYQAEISQGRLEALLNYQTMVSDLTGLEIANSSLLDEATAAAEAMLMLHSSRKRDKKTAETFLVAESVFPHTVDVLLTRAEPQGINVKIMPVEEFEFTDDVFGLLVQFPDAYGKVSYYRELFAEANQKQIFCAVAADLLSLTLFTPPGEIGADVAVGSTQRFGIPMGYGGPHAAYFAAKEDFKRQIPGRIIGISLDRSGGRALRMALQTREQHIKRERATSNICTAQVLLAIMAGMYAVYMGPDRLRKIAQKVHGLAQLLAEGVEKLGFELENKQFFDTIAFKLDEGRKSKLKASAESAGINLNYFFDNIVTISMNESANSEDVAELLDILAEFAGKSRVEIDELSTVYSIDSELERKSDFLTHPVFNSYHSETEMMRYIKKLENKDLSLTKSMIPLGSCTMKLNAATEMIGLGNSGLLNIHPFAPDAQTKGYRELIDRLENQLRAITGFHKVSFQPNSGAQGEYTGLMVIRQFHIANGNSERNVVLIPSSAHGTNPASAAMSGGKVVVVKCDEKGNIDINDLRQKAEENRENLSALMVTYPSTHGVFETGIKEICAIIHENGGQVYMDGANMNAQVGLTSPAEIGADVCHLNLHKTFAIPHGGGGPGMGPIAVAEHLAPYLPGHVYRSANGENRMKAVSAAHFGSASILPISYAYIRMLGAEGLVNSTKFAILNANYIMSKLKSAYKVVYTGESGFVGHELIFDMHEFKERANVEVEDIAKRLMDYGFHAPTVSFPVHGTLMVEPTESESKAELDRFCDAMLQIKAEIEAIEAGEADRDNNLLKNSPHTLEDITSDEWTYPYTKQQAVYPLEWVKDGKFWPSVSRVDNAYGDRNLMCSCKPIEEYEQ